MRKGPFDFPGERPLSAMFPDEQERKHLGVYTLPSHRRLNEDSMRRAGMSGGQDPRQQHRAGDRPTERSPSRMTEPTYGARASEKAAASPFRLRLRSSGSAASTKGTR